MWCGARFRLLDCWLLLARERWVSSLQYCWQLAGFGLYSKYPVPGVRAGRQAQRCYDTSPGAGEHPPALVTPNVTINKPRARKRKRTEQSGTRAVLSHATGRCGELKVVVQNRVVGVDPLLSHRAKGKKNCHNPNCKTRAKTDPFISHFILDFIFLPFPFFFLIPDHLFDFTQKEHGHFHLQATAATAPQPLPPGTESAHGGTRFPLLK